MKQQVSAGLNRGFLRGVAILAIAGFAAGCSSDTMRFSDNFYTGSVPNTPPSDVSTPVYEPYPGDVVAERKPDDRTYTRSVARDVSKPVDLTRSSIDRKPLPAATTSGPALAPVASSERQRRLDPVTTGSVKPDAPVAVKEGKSANGWTRTGGTQVTLRQGETIYNLSRRFGVPAKAILEANGISDATRVHAGQKIIIPTYVYSRNAPVSAPDSDPNTAAAKSSRGGRYDISEKKVPVPSLPPKRDAAILAGTNATRTESVGESNDDASSKAGSKHKSSGTYTVASGDTLWSISRNHDVTVDALRSANSISDSGIRVGQKLIIPNSSNSTAASASHVDKTRTASVRQKPEKTNKLPSYTPPKKKPDTIAKAGNDVTTAAPDATGAGAFRWPVRGRVVSEFGDRNGSKPNDGIDISVPSGTPVKAAENGVVIYAGNGLKEFGNTVLVRHEDGFVTVYGHADAIRVKRGERVRRGQDIAMSGMSGDAESPRLHFEIRKNSVPMNPLGYLN